MKLDNAPAAATNVSRPSGLDEQQFQIQALWSNASLRCQPTRK
jgi:hypothetical protein